MRKRIMIGAGIAAAVLIAVLCAILFASPKRGKGVENFDTDSAYDYSFASSRRGLSVSIKGGKENCVWTAKALQPIVTVGDASSEGGETAFLLSPAGNGTGRVEFTLSDKDDPSKRVYQLYADLLVSDQDITVVSSGHQEFAEEITDKEGRFTVTMLERGSYLVCMSPAIDAHWSTKTEGSSVLVESYDLWGDLELEDDKNATEQTHSLTMNTYFTLKCIGNEPATVYIYDRNHPKALEIKMEYDEQNGLYPASCAMVAYQSGYNTSAASFSPTDDPRVAHVTPEDDAEDDDAEKPAEGTEESAEEAEETGSEEKQ